MLTEDRLQEMERTLQFFVEERLARKERKYKKACCAIVSICAALLFFVIYAAIATTFNQKSPAVASAAVPQVIFASCVLTGIIWYNLEPCCRPQTK
ncbi:unnamed protein product [Bursaphelenchus okinawaensis]|uniref:Uncharacterized protein n=1 Tax=Bursaphelenchus okinawaensis TaxID=465554 RepID=A0A811LMD4_9BILA|nr:unnamed protein product [Bursaphelenchus okinawaensis]CAG9127101.1 unnamed protein product [Bursaphelenchus okinawaensis]